MAGSGIRRAVASFFTHLSALFFAGVSGSIVAIMAAYVLVYCVGLPLFIAAGLLGASVGGATLTVGGIALITFSLLAGLSIGTEVYIGVALPEDRRNGPMPGWVRALWAAAAGALVGALPCAAAVDGLLLGPLQAVPHALDSAAALATATHLVSLGGLTGAMTGITMERFRIWRRPCRNSVLLSSQITQASPRITDTAGVRTDPHL